MLKIDGSYGEGGGQIIRTAVALSALTGKAIEIENIRANRPNLGLQPQHLTAVEAVRLLCKAEVDGLEKGSRTLVFKPGKIRGGEFELDVGTAGNIPLIFQCCLPAALFADSPVRLKITGGTDTTMAPPIDYLRQVFLPAVAKMGAGAEMKVLRRGYYPKGGGQAALSVEPCKQLLPLKFEKLEISGIRGIAFASRLPEHIPQRIKAAAEKALSAAGFSAEIETEISDSYSPGTGIVLWAEGKSIGASALGAIGVPSEKVGAAAAEKLLAEIKSDAAVDVHALDQLIPYMALASGKSEVLAQEVSQHARTNIWLVEKFLGVKFEIAPCGELWRVAVEGVGFGHRV